MADLIDNVTYGQFIKALLKEKDVTVESVATLLSLSKIDMSARLNGRVPFTRPELLKIARKVKVGIEDLVMMRSTTSGKVAQTYQEMILNGYERFRDIAVEDLNLTEKDSSGRIFIDYLMAGTEYRYFSYLAEIKAEIMEDTHPKVENIYLKIISQMLREELPNVKYYIQKYAAVHGSFLISEQKSAQSVWKLINQDKYRGLIRELFPAKILLKSQDYTMFQFAHDATLLSRDEWFREIGSFQLNIVLDEYLNHNLERQDLYFFTHAMIENGYLDGIRLFLKAMNRDFPSKNDLKYMRAQETIMLVVDTRDMSLFQEFLNRGLYLDPTEITVKAITNQHEEMVNVCLTRFDTKLAYEHIAHAAVLMRNYPLFISVSGRIKPDTIDFLFAEAQPTEIELLETLLRLGASFKEKYPDEKRVAKMNNLLKHLMSIIKSKE